MCHMDNICYHVICHQLRDTILTTAKVAYNKATVLEEGRFPTSPWYSSHENIASDGVYGEDSLVNKYCMNSFLTSIQFRSNNPDEDCFIPFLTSSFSSSVYELNSGN